MLVRRLAVETGSPHISRPGILPVGLHGGGPTGQHSRFFVLRSCMFVGSTQSGSYFEGVKSFKTQAASDALPGARPGLEEQEVRGVRTASHRRRRRPADGCVSCEVFGKGQMGSALMGSLQMLCFLTEGLLGTPSTFTFQEVPGRTFFPNLSKFVTFAAAPLVLTPFVRNQGLARTWLPSRRRWRTYYNIVCYTLVEYIVI